MNAAFTQRRKDEQRRADELASIKYYAKTAGQSHFETKTDQRIAKNKIMATFNSYQRENILTLVQRKLKLKDLLESDEQKYKLELVTHEETKEERIERMKSRMTELKQKRESERLAIVEQQLLKKWRLENDDLKLIRSKLTEKRVSAARDIQLLEQRAKREEAIKEKIHFDQLYEKDRQRKIKREEADAERKKALNEDMIQKLTQQLDTLQKQEQEERRLVEEDGKIMRHQSELQAIQEARNHEAKLSAQRAIRADLDASNKQRIAQRAIEVKQSLELDIRIVNEFIKLDNAERDAKSRKREALRVEMLEYKDYLEKMREYERNKEKELDIMYQDEERKIWRIRAEKWQREQAARDKLMAQVLDGRREQLAFSAEQNKARLEQNRMETEALIRNIESAKAQDEQLRSENAGKSIKFASDLALQIKALEDRRQLERNAEALENDAQRVVNGEFQKLLIQETERLYGEFTDELVTK